MTETPHPTWGDTLKAQRYAAGFTAIGLARALRVHRTTVLYWQSGRRTPDAEMFARLRELLPDLPVPPNRAAAEKCKAPRVVTPCVEVDIDGRPLETIVETGATS